MPDPSNQNIPDEAIQAVMNQAEKIGNPIDWETATTIAQGMFDVAREGRR